MSYRIARQFVENYNSGKEVTFTKITEDKDVQDKVVEYVVKLLEMFLREPPIFEYLSPEQIKRYNDAVNPEIGESPLYFNMAKEIFVEGQLPPNPPGMSGVCTTSL